MQVPQEYYQPVIAALNKGQDLYWKNDGYEVTTTLVTFTPNNNSIGLHGLLQENGTVSCNHQLNDIYNKSTGEPLLKCIDNPIPMNKERLERQLRKPNGEFEQWVSVGKGLYIYGHDGFLMWLDWWLPYSDHKQATVLNAVDQWNGFSKFIQG